MPFSTRCMTDADWATLRYFRKVEFAHPEKMGYDFLLWLDKVRERAGVPMHRTSDYRDPAHNAEVGGAKASAHMDAPCNASDFGQLDNASRWAIVKAAIDLGCTRIGMYADGSLHLDRTEDERPAPRIWHIVENPA